MLSRFLKRRDDPFALAVSMTGVKMGDRVAFVGCANGRRLAAIAAKVGLSGQAVAVVPDDAAAARARDGAENVGVLVDVHMAPSSRLPLEDAGFDVAILDNSGDWLTGLQPEERIAAGREIGRVLRPGGRVVVLCGTPRRGLGSLIAGRPPESSDAQGIAAALEAGGFKSVRMLAARDGVAFFEGLKPRTP
jgi:SAM-dependent methyltransferase